MGVLKKENAWPNDALMRVAMEYDMEHKNCLELARLRRQLSERFKVEDRRGIHELLQLLLSYGMVDGKVVDTQIEREVERWRVRVDILNAIIELAA